MSALDVQQIPYLGPKLEVLADGVPLDDVVVSFDVWTSRFEPADVCTIVADGKYVDADAIHEGAPITVRWGYKGYDLDTIFNGLVDDVRPATAPRDRGDEGGERIRIRGVDPIKRLFETRVTKTFQDERPATILRNLITPLGIDTSGVVEVDTVLDRLPLYDEHIVHAICTINRRLNLDYQFWFDTQGVFHWAALTIPETPAWTFTAGENIIAFERRHGGARLTTIGIPARHGNRVVVQSNAGAAGTAYWIAAAHHYRPPKLGFRTDLDLREVPS